MATKKKTKKNKSENLYWLLGSLVAGAALVFLTDNKGNSGGLVVSDDKGGSGSPSSNPKPVPAPVVPKPSAPVPDVSIPKETQAQLDDTRKEHVVIDSFDGETLYENINDGFLAVFPWKDSILKLENRTYIGKLTGRKYKIMVEVTGMIEGTVRRYWVDEKEVELVTEKKLQEMLAYGNVKQMDPYITNLIDKYFKNK